MSSDILAGLGITALICIILIAIFIPFIIGIVIATAVAGYFGATGLLWWSIVIFVALLIWGILGVLSKYS